MDPVSFQTAMGDFPAILLNALVDLWNGEMAQAISTNALRYHLLG